MDALIEVPGLEAVLLVLEGEGGWVSWFLWAGRWKTVHSTIVRIVHRASFDSGAECAPSPIQYRRRGRPRGCEHETFSSSCHSPWTSFSFFLCFSLTSSSFATHHPFICDSPFSHSPYLQSRLTTSSLPDVLRNLKSATRSLGKANSVKKSSLQLPSPSPSRRQSKQKVSFISLNFVVAHTHSIPTSQNPFLHNHNIGM